MSCGASGRRNWLVLLCWLSLGLLGGVRGTQLSSFSQDPMVTQPEQMDVEGLGAAGLPVSVLEGVSPNGQRRDWGACTGPAIRHDKPRGGETVSMREGFVPSESGPGSSGSAALQALRLRGGWQGFNLKIPSLANSQETVPEAEHASDDSALAISPPGNSGLLRHSESIFEHSQGALNPVSIGCPDLPCSVVHPAGEVSNGGMKGGLNSYTSPIPTEEELEEMEKQNDRLARFIELKKTNLSLKQTMTKLIEEEQEVEEGLNGSNDLQPKTENSDPLAWIRGKVRSKLNGGLGNSDLQSAQAAETIINEPSVVDECEDGC